MSRDEELVSLVWKPVVVEDPQDGANPYIPRRKEATMPEYIITLNLLETYELVVEADNRDEAMQIADGTDIEEWAGSGEQTVSWNIERIDE